jgi:UDP-N-acetylenolpyruvoylglucosamine reductase
VNVDHATAEDVCRLVDEIRRRVKEKSGVDLELEIWRAGEGF